MWDKLKDMVFGKPKAHVVPPTMNRKQRRQQQHLIQKRNAAANRKEHEGRG